MKKFKLGNGLASDSILLTIAKLMTSVISIFTTKLLAVEFSLLDYGTYSQAILITTTATSLSIMGLSDGINFFYNSCSKKEEKKTRTNTIFCIQCILGLICAAIILLSSNLLTGYFENPALSGVYVYIMFTPLLTNFLSMFGVLYVASGWAKNLAIRNLIISLLKLATVAFAALVTEDIVTVFFVTLITDIFQVVYFSVYFGKKEFWINPFKINTKLIKTILAYCLPLAVYVLTNALCRDLDKYIISFFTDTETLAIYTNAAKILPFDMISSSFAVVMIPLTTKYVINNEFEKSQELYNNYLTFSYKTTWLIAFGAVVCSKELMLLLYDEKYISGLGIFVVYILVDMIRFANVTLILRAKGKTVALMLYSFGMLAVNFVQGIIFFHIFGIIGPAISTLVVTLVMNSMMLIQGANIIKTNIFKLLDFKDMGLTILGMLLAGAIAFAIRSLCNYFSFHYLITFILAYGCYAVIVFALNIKKVLWLLKNMNKMKVR